MFTYPTKLNKGTYVKGNKRWELKKVIKEDNCGSCS